MRVLEKETMSAYFVQEKSGIGQVLLVGWRQMGGHHMDSLKLMNKAMDYIETHLTEDIDMATVSRLAWCSEYHFKRMFSFLAGVTLTEYIRLRRLTLAAFELSTTHIKVIDAAVKYGYQSPDAFTRAFQQFHGINPSEVRSNQQPLKVFSPMTFQLTIKGGVEMKYRLEEKEAFRIVGLMKRVPIIFEGVNPEIAAMWQQLNEEKIKELKALSNTHLQGMISASVNFDEGRMEEQGSLDHYIGVATTNPCPVHYSSLEVAAGTWAVFEVEGSFPQALQNTWGRIYSEWFPTSRYEGRPGPEILWNEENDLDSPHFKSEIWIPVKAKE